MAQAQVVISAVDRTQVAINSALRGMKTLERTAKVTSKAINLAFGFLSGTLLINAFGKITEAAKKTEEGRRAIDNLNKALKDPALVSAANTFTTAIVKGFTEIVKFSTEAIKKIKEVGQSLGVIGPSVDTSGPTFGGPRSRYKRANIDETTRMENDWKFRMSMWELEKKWAEETKQKADAARMASAQREADQNQRYQDLKNTLGELPELYESNFKASELTVSKSTQAILDDLAAKQELFKNFAEGAAQSMQSAFADFLFDPFANGLKGMLLGFINVIRRMIAEIVAQQILVAIFSGFTGGSGPLATFAKAITGRASGGPVSRGTPYIVGERGPELFVPNSSGSIVPNNRMGGMTIAPVYNIDARGATMDLQKALPGIMQENNRRIFDELDRRYGLGR